MNAIAAARAEIKTLMDEAFSIVAKNGGVIDDRMPNEDRARIAEIRSTVAPKEGHLDQLIADAGSTDWVTKGREQYSRPIETHRQPDADPRGAYAASLGSGVVDSETYRDAKRNGQLAQTRPQLRVQLPPGVSILEEAKRAGLSRELKALLTSADASGGAFVVPDRLAGYTTLTRQELGWLDVLPTLSTTSDVVEWVQQDTRVNNAAPVLEATATTGTTGLKPESDVRFSIVSKPVETIATWVPVTTRIMNDAPMLRSTVDDELLYMVREEVEEQTIIGNGTSPQLLGLNNVPGIQTLAAGGFANAADALFAAALAVRFTGGVPATVAAVGVATMSAIRLLRESGASGGGYIMGPPNMPGPMTVFGLTVVPVQAVPANTAFVLNATPTTIALVEREGGTVETGWIDNQFVRNMLTLLAEWRGVLATRRPKGIVKVTGLP
jgi:HK97 family phage major capsid protein